MLGSSAVALFFGLVLCVVYIIGVIEGKHIQRNKRDDELDETIWMLDHAIEQWSPWTFSSTSEARARLLADYHKTTRLVD